jgi:hypothetical protein
MIILTAGYSNELKTASNVSSLPSSVAFPEDNASRSVVSFKTI